MLLEKKMIHIQLFRFHRSELGQILENRIRKWLTPSMQEKKEEPPSLFLLCKSCDEKSEENADNGVLTFHVFKRIMFQYDEVFESHCQCQPSEFAKDDFFRQKAAEMLDCKRWCEHKLELWLKHLDDSRQSDMKIAIYFYPLAESHKFWIANLRREIEELRSSPAELKPLSCSPRSRRPSLAELCHTFLKAKGIIPCDTCQVKNEDFLVEVNTSSMYSCLQDAAGNGWSEEDLLALLDICKDCEKFILHPLSSGPASSNSLPSCCLHVAAAHGNNCFLETVFSYLCSKLSTPQASPRQLPARIVFPSFQEGQTPLYIAAENGHSSCIKVLLRYCPDVPRSTLSPISVAISRSHQYCARLLISHFSSNAPAETARSFLSRASHGFTPLMRAVSCGDAEMVEFLLLAGASVHQSSLSVHADDESNASEQQYTFTVDTMMQQKDLKPETVNRLQNLFKLRENAGDDLEHFKLSLKNTQRN
jgi:ankyrin repeat protein